METATPTRFYVACGSYDGSVFAMSYDHHTISETGPTRLKAEFIDPDAHPSPITALAIADNVVASGSADEAIQIFSLAKCSRMGCLELHTGSIRQLVFADSRHLLSAGEDACLAIWRRTGGGTSASAWQCIRQMRRHKASITALALHPSLRAAVTLSTEDRTLRIWNLTRGRQAYTTRLKALNAEGAVGVSMCGSSGRYLMLTWPYDRVDIVDLAVVGSDAKPLLSAKFPQNFSVPPVVFHEDETYLYLLAGFGNILKGFRCPLHTTGGGTLNVSKLESLGETRLPGKRLKFLRAFPWPAELVKAHPDVYGGCRRLVTLVTTDADGSFVRGYAVNLEPGENTSPCLSAAQSVRGVFTYDIKDIRLTQIDAAWQAAEAENQLVMGTALNDADEGSEDDLTEEDESDEEEKEVEIYGSEIKD